MSAIYSPYYYLMVYRYRYSSVFLMLYQLYHSLPSSTLISSSSLYLKLQPELLLKVITEMHTYFGIPDVAAKVAHSLDHLCMNSDNWIAIYNVAFLWYSA